MVVSKNFETIHLSPPALATGGLSPSGWATGPKCKKKFTFRFWHPGRIKQRTCKIDIKSQKNRKNTNSTVLDSMKQYLQLLLYKVFHLINVSCSILNTSLMHFYLNLKIHLWMHVIFGQSVAYGKHRLVQNWQAQKTFLE